jgi:hypothetical protein
MQTPKTKGYVIERLRVLKKEYDFDLHSAPDIFMKFKSKGF